MLFQHEVCCAYWFGLRQGLLIESGGPGQVKNVAALLKQPDQKRSCPLFTCTRVNNA